MMMKVDYEGYSWDRSYMDSMDHLSSLLDHFHLLTLYLPVLVACTGHRKSKPQNTDLQQMGHPLVCSYVVNTVKGDLKKTPLPVCNINRVSEATSGHVTFNTYNIPTNITECNTHTKGLKFKFLYTVT